MLFAYSRALLSKIFGDRWVKIYNVNLNSIYQYYCNKGDIEYKPLTKSKIIKLDDDIIQILDRVYLKYPHIKIEEQLYDFDVDYL